MTKIAVIKIGGKQYLVKENDILIVDKIDQHTDDEVELETLAIFDKEGNITIGTPVLKQKVKAKILEKMIKGDKIRVAHFKAKVRYRKVRGFRPHYSKLQILTIS